MIEEDAAARKSTRREVRVYRLGEEPRDDLRERTTAEERLIILRKLTERAWALGEKAMPSYSRSRIPVHVTRAR
jgi:hypothetical protein